MAEPPHPGIRVLAVMVGAGVIGATLASMGPPFTLGWILVGLAITLLAFVGSFGIAQGDPVVGALAGLGCLLLIDAIPELSLFLLFGAVGFVVAALLAAVQETLRRRRAGQDDD